MRSQELCWLHFQFWDVSFEVGTRMSTFERLIVELNDLTKPKSDSMNIFTNTHGQKYFKVNQV